MDSSIIVGIFIVGVIVVVVLDHFGKMPRHASSVPTPIIPWYEDPTQTIAIRPYASAEMATRAANLVAGYGWSVQSISTSDGHVNVGRTVTGAVLTGGISLLIGGSRTKGTVTVTFTRPAVSLAHDPLPLRSGAA